MENTLPKSVQDALQGWANLNAEDFTSQELDLLSQAADYKESCYAIVDDAKIRCLKNLGIMTYETSSCGELFFMFKNGATPAIFMEKDFTIGYSILLFFGGGATQQESRTWKKYFKADEFQGMYPGLVSLICRAAHFRKNSPDTLNTAVRHFDIAYLSITG